jgi:hypothetical protein
MICLGIMGDNLEKEVGWDVQKTETFQFSKYLHERFLYTIEGPFVSFEFKNLLCFMLGKAYPNFWAYSYCT